MQLPDIYNYIGVLLTLRCNFKCSYCLNWRMNRAEKFDTYWLEAIDKIETDLPITLSGGEPSIHGAFFPFRPGAHFWLPVRPLNGLHPGVDQPRSLQVLSASAPW